MVMDLRAMFRDPVFWAGLCLSLAVWWFIKPGLIILEVPRGAQFIYMVIIAIVVQGGFRLWHMTR